MRSSESVTDLHVALAKAQATIENPEKNKKNPHFKSAYADFAAVINAIREVYAENGLTIIQGCENVGERWILQTRVTHSSGQWIESDMPVVADGRKPQEFGSALTYARRYALMGMTATAGDDDDAHAAQSAAKDKKFLTDEQVREIKAYASHLGFDKAHWDRFIKPYGSLEVVEESRLMELKQAVKNYAEMNAFEKN